MSCEELHDFSRHSRLGSGSIYNTPHASFHQGEVLTAALLKIQVFCDVKSCGMVNSRRGLGTAYYPHHYCLTVLMFWGPHSLKKRALRSPKTFATVSESVWCNIPQDLNLQKPSSSEIYHFLRDNTRTKQLQIRRQAENEGNKTGQTAILTATIFTKGCTRRYNRDPKIWCSSDLNQIKDEVTCFCFVHICFCIRTFTGEQATNDKRRNRGMSLLFL